MNDIKESSTKKIAIIAAVMVLAIIAGLWGRPVYRNFKEKHYLHQAQSFLKSGDLRNAMICTHLTLQINSNSVPALSIMAELEDSIHSPATLDIWQRVVELSPTIDNKLSLAAAAMRYQYRPYPLATQMLDELSQTGSHQPNYYFISAELALAMNRLGDAQADFEAERRLDPTNQLSLFNLDVLHLADTNAAVAAEARSSLKQFFGDKNLGPLALRSLIMDRMLRDDASGALSYSTQLVANAGATLNDRLQYIGILKNLHSPEMTSQLNSLQRDSTTNGLMTAQVATWMASNGLLTGATDWLTGLPEKLRSQPPVRLALANCYLAWENWQALRDIASKGSWGEMECVRLAYLSRAWSKLGEPVVADGDWNSAVSIAGEQPAALNALMELATDWNMKSAQEDLLWRILQMHPDEEWAPRQLEQLYSESGNTKGLYQLYSARLIHSPKSVELENNTAFISLLLKTNLNSAYAQAAEVYARAANNPTVAATYAYALHLQGRDKEGLTVLQKLGKPALERPSVALYYGVLLSATGDNTEARSFLHLAKSDSHLLPEEKKLLAESLR